MWTWLAASKCVLCCSVCKSESVFNQNPSVLPGSKQCTCKQLTNVAGSMCWLSALSLCSCPLPIARTHSHSLYNYLCIALGIRHSRMHMRFSSVSTFLLSLPISMSVAQLRVCHLDLSICVVVLCCSPDLCALFPIKCCD